MLDFMKYSNIKIEETDTGYARASIALQAHHLNYYGYTHGGVYYTLADSTAGAATHHYEGDWITLNGQINYMKAVKGGVLTATAKTLTKTRKTVVIRVEIKSDYEHLATATMTMYRVK